MYTGTNDQSFSYPSAKELWFGGLEKASDEEKQIIRPCFSGKTFTRVEGSHAYTSYPQRAIDFHTKNDKPFTLFTRDAKRWLS